MGLQVAAAPAPVRRRRAGVGAILGFSPMTTVEASSLALVPPAINHFAFMPAEGIRGVQVRLAVWGRPRMLPDTSDPYGYSGPLFPGDFADENNTQIDLDGNDSHRTGLAIASFQRWHNAADAASNSPLRTDGIYDEATHNKLVALTGVAPQIPAAPGMVGGYTKSPLPSGLPNLPEEDDLPGSANLPPANKLPPSVPGSIGGASATTSDAPIWPWIAIAAGLGGLVVIGVIVRRKRRRSA